MLIEKVMLVATESLRISGIELKTSQYNCLYGAILRVLENHPRLKTERTLRNLPILGFEHPNEP